MHRKKKTKKKAFTPSSKYSFIRTAQQYKWFKGNLPKLLEKFVPTLDGPRFISALLDRYEEWNKHSGTEYAISRFKYAYDCSLRYAGNCQMLPQPNSWMKTDREGLPLLVKPVKPYLLGSEMESKMVLIILNSFKDPGYTPSSVDTNPITMHRRSYDFEIGPPGTFYIQSRHQVDKQYKPGIGAVWKYVLEEAFPLEQQQQRIADLKSLSQKIHTSAKNGPNGPCVRNASVDWIALASRPENKILFEAIKRLGTLTRNKPLVRILNRFSKDENLRSVQDELANKTLPVSKLSIKTGESWGKKRLFAIGDYFSQSSLTGMHDYMFRWLEQQPGDGTFDQNKVAAIVKEWTGSPDISAVYSADLSSATDHIPVKLLYEIIFQMFGEGIAKSWLLIMTERDFHLSFDMKTTVRYTTGQPLGLLTSWAIMSIWHHLTYRVCCRLANIKYPLSNKSKRPIVYVVLGDDSSNIHSEIARAYQHVVGGHCDIGMSPVKGFSPDNLICRERRQLPEVSGSLKTAELAKRIFSEGLEVTPVPAAVWQQGLESPTSFFELLVEIQRRTGLPQAEVTSLGTTLLALSKRRTASFKQVTFPLWPILKIELPSPISETTFNEFNITLSPPEVELYSLPQEALEYKVVKTLKGKMLDNLRKSHYELMVKFNELESGAFDVCKKYHFHSLPQRELYRTVFMQYYTSLARAEKGLRAKAEIRHAAQVAEIIPFKEVVQLSSRLNFVQSVNDMIVERRRERLSPRTETSKLISSVVQQVYEPVALWEMSAYRSYFDDQIYIINYK